MITIRKKKSNVFARFGNYLRNSSLGEGVRSALLPWLELVRLPNLFTAFGDPLAGACYAAAVTGKELSGWSLLDICFCSIVLYAFGVIQNDWCDFPEDSRLRPNRPLPSRKIPILLAVAVAFACLIVGAVLAAMNGRHSFIVAVVLIVLISAYNFSMKRKLAPGAVCMGLCRGLNVLLGASLIGITPAIIVPVLTAVVYIACVTWLADGENRRQIPGKNIFYPMYAAAAGWLVSLPFIPFSVFKYALLPSIICLLAAEVNIMLVARRIYNKTVAPESVRRYIGILIESLIPLQAAWIMFGAAEHCIAVIIWGVIAWLLCMFTASFISRS